MAERDTSEKEEAIEKLAEGVEPSISEVTDEWDDTFELLAASSQLATESLFQDILEQNRRMWEEITRPIILDYQTTLAATILPITDMQDQLVYDLTQPIREMEDDLVAMTRTSFDLSHIHEALAASITADIVEITESQTVVPPVDPIQPSNFQSHPSSDLHHSTEFEGTDEFWYITCYLNGVILYLCYKYDSMIRELGLEPAKEELARRQILYTILLLWTEKQISGTF